MENEVKQRFRATYHGETIGWYDTADEAEAALDRRIEYDKRINDEYVDSLHDTGVISYDPITDDMSCTCGNVSSADGFVTCDKNGLECEPTRELGWDEESFVCMSCGATGKFPNIFDR